MKPADTIIFDLDGTLLYTLDDLANSVNHALCTFGLPIKPPHEIRLLLGNGVRRLVQGAAPADISGELFEQVFQCFRAHYVEHCYDTTRPYPGILPLLGKLKARGTKMAIVSNKLQPAVTELNKRFFSEYITVAVGESATVRRKPCPDAVLEALRLLGSSPENALYAGDSEVDIETAENAGMNGITVLWGFRDEDFLRAFRPEAAFIRQPEELLAFVE